MFRVRMASLVGLLLGLAGLGTAQPATPPAPPRPVIVEVIPYVTNETVGKEWQLTAEQVKSLADYRQKLWDENFVTAPAEMARHAATAKRLGEVLTPEQAKRATQFAAQVALRDADPTGGFNPAPSLVRVPSTVFTAYAEFADVVKLTPEQKKLLAPPDEGKGRVRFGEQPIVVLTPDQTAALAKFVGPVSAESFRGTFDPRLNQRFADASPLTSPVLFGRPSPAVQKEIGLSAEQSKKLTDMQAERNRINRNNDDALSPEKALARTKEMQESQKKAVADLLTPEQAARVKQMELWTRVGSPDNPLAVYRVAEVAEAVGLSDDQKKAVADAAEAYRAAFAQAFEADGPLDALKQRLAAAAEARKAAAERVVTPEQRAKLKELLGAEYRDTRFAGRGGAGGFGGPPSLAIMRTAYFGRYVGQLAMTSAQPQFRAELKLTDEQQEKVAAAIDGLRQTPGPSPAVASQEEADKLAAARSAAIETALKDILTPAQQARMREVAIQYYEQLGSVNPNRLATVMTVGLPGVAEALELTAEQRKTILGGTTPAEVLTADQKARLKKLAGEPVKGGFPDLGSTVSARTALSPGLTLLDNGQAGPELKLAPEQEYKIALALEEHQAATRVPAGGRTATTAAQRTRQQEAQAKCEAAVNEVLTVDQKARLAQLELQSAASASLTAALRRPEVAAKLTLTDAQRDKLAAVAADYRERAQLATQLGNQATPFVSRDIADSQAQQRLTAGLRTKARDRMLAVLTDGQKAAWKEMTGPPANLTAGRRVFDGVPFGPGALLDP